jgi:hypothetical protein
VAAIDVHGEFSLLRLLCGFTDAISLAQLEDMSKVLIPPYQKSISRYFDRLDQNRVTEANLVDFNCQGAHDMNRVLRSFLHIGYQPQERRLVVKYCCLPSERITTQYHPVVF